MASEVDRAPRASTGDGSSPAMGGAARLVASGEEIQRALVRMAHEILEANHGAQRLLLLGIPTRGVPLARRLAQVIGEVEGTGVLVGELDVTMYRDDLRRQPTRNVRPTLLPAPVDGAVIVVVDDVLYSGRTVVAALDALKDLGRPRTVRLAVLVDRGHRQVPVRADHVGKNLPTSASERVSVRLAETDGTDEVTIIREPEPDHAVAAGPSEEGQPDA